MHARQDTLLFQHCAHALIACCRSVLSIALSLAVDRPRGMMSLVTTIERRVKIDDYAVAGGALLPPAGDGWKLNHVSAVVAQHTEARVVTVWERDADERNWYVEPPSNRDPR